ncbi:hypothetical protein [Roseivivax lentus]|uniref:hypothetical protein n=1 Tax=Roseivivax lentus TaxID=633194 RepID=UPI00117B3D35|nr:hypothetical protein [Roseivivax lentus]
MTNIKLQGQEPNWPDEAQLLMSVSEETGFALDANGDISTLLPIFHELAENKGKLTSTEASPEDTKAFERVMRSNQQADKITAVVCYVVANWLHRNKVLEQIVADADPNQEGTYAINCKQLADVIGVPASLVAKASLSGVKGDLLEKMISNLQPAGDLPTPVRIGPPEEIYRCAASRELEKVASQPSESMRS